MAVWMIEDERRGRAWVLTTALPSPPVVEEEVDALEPGEEEELEEEERSPSSC